MKTHMLDQPDIQGPAGQAWLCEQHVKSKTAQDLAVFVFKTIQEKYSVICMHEFDDEETRHYELIVLDDQPILGDEFNPRSLDFARVGLWPEIIEDIKVDSDEKAEQVVTDAVAKCATGELNPSIDFAEKWHEFIADETIRISH